MTHSKLFFAPDGTFDVRSRQDHPRTAGFTLIEIMAVVLIIGLLSTLVGVSIFGQVNEARVTTARVQIKSLESALEAYHLKHAAFPSSEDGLNVLPDTGYLRNVPKDPWGNSYQYENPGQINVDYFDLWSFGADGQSGGDGVDADFGNWSDDGAGA